MTRKGGDLKSKQRDNGRKTTSLLFLYLEYKESQTHEDDGKYSDYNQA